METHTHPDFGSGNISMVFDRDGNLHIANDGFIYLKEAGELDIVKRFVLPYTGIGDLEIDSAGNLYLSDPFINDTVYCLLPTAPTKPFTRSIRVGRQPFSPMPATVWMIPHPWHLSFLILLVTRTWMGTAMLMGRIWMISPLPLIWDVWQRLVRHMAPVHDKASMGGPCLFYGLVSRESVGLHSRLPVHRPRLQSENYYHHC